MRCLCPKRKRLEGANSGVGRWSLFGDTTQHVREIRQRINENGSRSQKFEDGRLAGWQAEEESAHFTVESGFGRT